MGGYILAGLWAGLRLVRRWKPDLLHAHFAVPTGALAWALHRATGIPYVLTAHLGDVPGGVPEKTAGWFRWVYPFTPPIWRSAARRVAVSEHTRQLALSRYPSEIAVIPNGVDTQALDPGEICVGQPPRLIFAGRFMPQKNPLGFVRMLATVRDLPWTCWMVGDGPLRPEIELEIARQGLHERICLTGWVTPEEVNSYLKRSDLLFMPSLSEGLPVVGVQALASGLAIVASRVGGFVDLVAEGENGYLHDPSDQTGFEASLRRLLTDHELLVHFRRNSRQHAESFDIRAVGRAYETVFQQVVGE
jgi:glycosyltransferase involved in cell wall biosynthesis